MEGVATQPGFLVRAHCDPAPVYARRARLFSVASLWVGLTLAFRKFSSRCVVTRIFPPSDRMRGPSVPSTSITACNNSPTRNTRLAHSQSIPESPLPHRHVTAIFDVQLRAPSATWSTLDTFLRGRTPSVGRMMREVLNTRRNAIYHFPSSARTSVLGQCMICKGICAPARHTCPLSSSGHCTGNSGNHEGGMKA